jgi:hypothetical protein
MSDDTWLDLPRVESGSKLTEEQKRFKSITKSLVGKSKTWACDGEYVAFRRKKANPATLDRHERFLRTGDYKHIGTQDDVEIYKLMESSPFKRKDAINFEGKRFYDARREVIRAAVRRDWATFIDGLEYLAGMLKGQYDGGTSKLIYQDMLTYIFIQITMRGGPSQQEVDREVAALRSRRGDRRSTSLVLPTGIALS